MRVRETLDTVLTAAMAVGALTVATLWIRREMLAPPVRLAEVTEARNWTALSSDASTSWGPPNARVTVVAFSDFQCPFCKTFAERIATVSDEFPKDVRFVFRHLPITWSHPHAVSAALAAECAAMQGRFRAFHDTLFVHQAQLTTRTWTQYAVAAGVSDTGTFAACMEAPATATRLTRDSLTASAEEVAGTPTVYVNGKRFAAPPSVAQLREQVKLAIGSNRSDDCASR
jgi:protein-disulfide isomerase